MENSVSRFVTKTPSRPITHALTIANRRASLTSLLSQSLPDGPMMTLDEQLTPHRSASSRNFFNAKHLAIILIHIERIFKKK